MTTTLKSITPEEQRLRDVFAGQALMGYVANAGLCTSGMLCSIEKGIITDGEDVTNEEPVVFAYDVAELMIARRRVLMSTDNVVEGPSRKHPEMTWDEFRTSLDVRSRRTLDCAGVDSFDKLLEQTDVSLLNIKNCGRRTVKAIRDRMKEEGMILKTWKDTGVC